MKKKLAFMAVLILITGPGLVFAGPSGTQAAPPAGVKQEDTKAREFKAILLKLVRQDEYLDETIDTLGASGGRLSTGDISATGLSLKLIAGNLNKVSALNKTEFASVEPGSADTRYIAAIFSYAGKVDRKSAQVGKLVTRLSAKNNKVSMRDAVSSRKGASKTRGRKLDQLLTEQVALARLADDSKDLRAASRGAAATSKWLYIASK